MVTTRLSWCSSRNCVPVVVPLTNHIVHFFTAKKCSSAISVRHPHTSNQGNLFAPARNKRNFALTRSSWLDDPIEARAPLEPDRSLINEDFAPTGVGSRTFDTWDLAALWIGLVVSIPTYYLAGGLVELGMCWWQGIVTVFLGNVVTLLPMVLNGHPGTKYGIPFPVLARASFGIKGAILPSLLRALVACGWFGIQSWVGGSSIHMLLNAATGGAVVGPVVSWLGVSFSQLACFMVFWLTQVGIIMKGIESIRLVEKYSAPILIVLSGALLCWAYGQAGGWGPMLAAPSQFVPGGPKAGQFWGVFLAAVTANVGFWATLSLNIPDFTRYARSQRDQFVGQAVGLPLFMAAFTFVGLAVTSATVCMYGAPISDPIVLLGKQQGLMETTLGLIGLILATLTTNIAANVVAPANALVSLKPASISFTRGGLLTAMMGAIIMPWRLVESTRGFIFTWLIGYSVILGPIGGIIIADYYILRKRHLDVDALYSSKPEGAYYYKGGWNRCALIALLVSAMPSFPGLLCEVFGVPVAPLFTVLYNCTWFVGFSLSIIVYYALMRGTVLNSKPHDITTAITG